VKRDCSKKLGKRDQGGFRSLFHPKGGKVQGWREKCDLQKGQPKKRLCGAYAKRRIPGLRSGEKGMGGKGAEKKRGTRRGFTAYKTFVSGKMGTQLGTVMGIEGQNERAKGSAGWCGF